MLEWFTAFSEVFVPIFVAMSPVTVLPIFLTMTEGYTLEEMRSLGRRAVLTAFCIAVSIVLLGQALFRFLGITVDDLRVAGGVVLFVISTYELIFTQEQRKKTEISSDVGVVPLGTPLIVGPATMTAAAVLADTHGRALVILALSISLLITGLMLHYANAVKILLRPAIARAFGKVMSLFLAAIAVAMLRSGIMSFIHDQ